VKEVLIIVNPASGGGRTGRGWPQIAERLREEGLVFDSALTERPGEATELARDAVREGRPVVVAAGGDGTIHEVAGGFFTGGEPNAGQSAMGIVPLGTGGDFRRTLGVPKDAAAAARILLAGRRRTVDVGRCRYRAGEGDRTEVFINIASCGLGGEVVRRVNGGMRLPTGELTFTLAIAISLLRWRNRRLRLTVDGAEHEVVAQQVAVANCRYYGAGLQIAPEAMPDDGLFDVVTVGDVSLVENLGLLRPLRQGSHLGMAKIGCQRGRRVEVTPVEGGPVRLDLDGEQPGILPALFELLPGALPLVAP
jgi:YegS/Rv2252/BmrU family lipid kinase